MNTAGRRRVPLPWPLFASELAGTAVLVLVGLSLVIVMFGDGSPRGPAPSPRALTAAWWVFYHRLKRRDGIGHPHRPERRRQARRVARPPLGGRMGDNTNTFLGGLRLWDSTAESA